MLIWCEFWIYSKSRSKSWSINIIKLDNLSGPAVFEFFAPEILFRDIIEQPDGYLTKQVTSNLFALYQSILWNFFG